jgi:hypothetical protein
VVVIRNGWPSYWLGDAMWSISDFPGDGISYEESKVFMNLTKDAIRQAPEYYVPPVGTEDHHTRDFRD